MMKKCIVIVLFFINTFLFFNTCAYTYQVRVLKKYNSYLKRNQYIIGCSDYHEKSDPANEVQRSYVESLLKKYSRQELTCIVEDLSSINSNGRMACCGYVLSTSGLLGGIAQLARSLRKDVDNIEYRYCRVAGIGPLLTYPDKDPKHFVSSCALTVGSLYNEVMNEIKIIRRYNDGSLLNNFYNRSIEDVTRAMNRLEISYNQKKSIAQFCAQRKNSKYQQFLQELCTFDSELVDSKLIHSIVGISDKPYILIFAGGAHINNVFDVLGRIGYHHEYSSSIVFGGGIKHSLQVQAKKGSCSRPRAVDIRIVEKFMK